LQEKTLGQHKPDGEFDPDRNRWLRKHKRAPLEKRFEELFGLEGVWLLGDLRAAFAGQPDAFDRHARTILWHCAKIPPEHNGMERRRKYVRASMLERRPLRDDSEANMDELEDRSSPAEKTIAELFEDRGYSLRTALDLYLRLREIYQPRWPRDDDRVDMTVERILRNATTKKHPLKYLRVVIRNEARTNAEA
jgi:hypothetical protein